MADPIKKDAIDKQTKKNNPTRAMMGSREFISFLLISVFRRGLQSG